MSNNVPVINVANTGKTTLAYIRDIVSSQGSKSQFNVKANPLLGSVQNNNTFTESLIDAVSKISDSEQKLFKSDLTIIGDELSALLEKHNHEFEKDFPDSLKLCAESIVEDENLNFDTTDSLKTGSKAVETELHEIIGRLDDSENTIEEIVVLLLMRYPTNSETFISDSSKDQKILKDNVESIQAIKPIQATETGAMETLSDDTKLQGQPMVESLKQYVSKYPEKNTSTIQALLKEEPIEDYDKLTPIIQNLIETEEVTPELKKLLKQYHTASSVKTEEPKEVLIREIKRSIVKEIKDTRQNGIVNEIGTSLIPSKDSKLEVAGIADVKMKKLLHMMNKVNFQDNENYVEGEVNKKFSLSNLTESKPTNNFKIFNSKDSRAEDSISKEDRFLEGLLDDSSKMKEVKGNNIVGNFQTANLEAKNEVNKEQVSINKATFVGDVIKVVKFLDKNNIKELKVSINPKDLGELIVTVTVEAGKMKASIAASNKEAYSMLMSNVDEIKNSFSNTDIRIQEFSINIYNGDASFFKDGSHRQGTEFEKNNNNYKVNNSDNEDDIVIDETNNSLIDGQINILA